MTTTQPIKSIRVYGPIGEYGDMETYYVGEKDVTEIRAVQKEGSMSYIPYVQVWKGEKLFAEFCQHNITGVYFA